MLPYILFIGIEIFLYYRKSYLGMLFVMIAFACLRYDTGWDYNMYEDIVNGTRHWAHPDSSRYSYPWRQLFKWAHFMHFPHIAIIIPNILTYICIYWGLKIMKLSRQQKADALFTYICWYELYLGSFSTIRQALSISFGLLIFAFLQDKKYILSLLILSISIVLHTSSYILVLLYPVYFLRKHLNFKWICIGACTLIIAVSSLREILTRLEVLDLGKYSEYFKLKDNYGGKVIYVNLILVAYLLFCFILRKKNSDVDKQCYLLSVIALMGNITVYLAGLPNTISRVFIYFIVFIIPILLPSLSLFKERKILKPFFIIGLASFFIIYIYISQDGTKLASSGFVPYKSILMNM